MDLMTYALCKGNGGGGGGDNRFIVTLTPTAQDYSGTMDKTVAEIKTAYDAGQQIKFKLITGADSYMLIDVAVMAKRTDFTYPSFNAFIIDSSNNLLIFGYTGITSDGTKQTYNTDIYSLTQVS